MWIDTKGGILIKNMVQWGREEAKIIFAKIIKQILEERKQEGRKVTQRELAAVLGISEQGFTNKMSRDSFFVDDVVKIADYLGYKVILKGENEYEIK